jgi:hypothetical protein
MIKKSPVDWINRFLFERESGYIQFLKRMLTIEEKM